MLRVLEYLAIGSPTRLDEAPHAGNQTITETMVTNNDPNDDAQ